jgi:hypothetical protein
MLGLGKGISFLVFIYTILGLFLDIIVHFGYLIEFQDPLVSSIQVCILRIQLK